MYTSQIVCNSKHMRMELITSKLEWNKLPANWSGTNCSGSRDNKLLRVKIAWTCRLVNQGASLLPVTLPEEGFLVTIKKITWKIK